MPGIANHMAVSFYGRFKGFPARATRTGRLSVSRSLSSCDSARCARTRAASTFFRPVISSCSFLSARCIPTVSCSFKSRSVGRVRRDMGCGSRKLHLICRRLTTPEPGQRSPYPPAWPTLHYPPGRSYRVCSKRIWFSSCWICASNSRRLAGSVEPSTDRRPVATKEALRFADCCRS